MSPGRNQPELSSNERMQMKLFKGRVHIFSHQRWFTCAPRGREVIHVMVSMTAGVDPGSVSL